MAMRAYCQPTLAPFHGRVLLSAPEIGDSREAGIESGENGCRHLASRKSNEGAVEASSQRHCLDFRRA